MKNQSNAQAQITAKKVGRTDYMGFAWHVIYVDGTLIENRKLKAADQTHAIAMYNQLTSK